MPDVIVGGVIGEPPHVAAVRVHQIQVGAAAARGLERDVAAVRRPPRLLVVPIAVTRQRGDAPGREIDRVELDAAVRVRRARHVGLKGERSGQAGREWRDGGLLCASG